MGDLARRAIDDIVAASYPFAENSATAAANNAATRSSPRRCAPVLCGSSRAGMRGLSSGGQK